MSEKRAYQNFRDHVKQPGDRIDRIENSVGVGAPDINLCAEGRECWVELKSPREPKRPGTPLFGSNHKLSVDQKNWFHRQTRAGGRCFILIRTNRRWLLIHGNHADALNTYTLQDLILISLWTIPYPIVGDKPWQRLRYELIHR
jgi:hypothetical protein